MLSVEDLRRAMKELGKEDVSYKAQKKKHETDHCFYSPNYRYLVKKGTSYTELRKAARIGKNSYNKKLQIINFNSCLPSPM